MPVNAGIGTTEDLREFNQRRLPVTARQLEAMLSEYRHALISRDNLRAGTAYRALMALAAPGVVGTLPPSGTAVGSCHCLIAHGVTQEWEWHGDGWGVPGNPHSVSPRRMSELGWRYVAAAHGVAIPLKDQP